MILTGRERYEWLVPVGLKSSAHAFIPGAKFSLCLKAERFPVGHRGYEREQLLTSEPKRARCGQCARILRRNPDMHEVPE